MRIDDFVRPAEQRIVEKKNEMRDKGNTIKMKKLQQKKNIEKRLAAERQKHNLDLDREFEIK